jgi:hypothetical protein
MGLINKIEPVQKPLLRVLAYKANRTNVSLNQIASEFNIVTLKNKRTFHDVSWLFKLLNSQIVCLELISQIPLNVPQTNSRVSKLELLKHVSRNSRIHVKYVFIQV